MDCFVASLLAMTVVHPDTTSLSRGTLRPRFAGHFRPQNKGAGNAGCALHPRSRAQMHEKMRTRAYRFSGGNPTFPAQWLYGLYRALPGDEFVLSPSSA